MFTAAIRTLRVKHSVHDIYRKKRIADGNKHYRPYSGEYGLAHVGELWLLLSNNTQRRLDLVQLVFITICSP